MISIDGDVITIDGGTAGERRIGIGTPEAFRLLSRLWLRSGWDTKYVYGFTWLGRPIIQLPDDLIRLQEVIYRIRPDVIIETGIAHGGSLVFSASLCELIGRGRVIGVDVEIRPHNRQAIEEHPLARRIELIEGDSVAPAIVERVRSRVAPGDTVLVCLDSCHTKQHVLAELRAYGPLVSPGSYIIAMDGIMEEVAGAPRTEADWTWNNPKRAAAEFVRDNADFVVEEPPFPFNEGLIAERVTYWPGAFVKRREAAK
ncbi:MAG: CmcI family methyltransferase [Planctomycetales bacterium]